MPTAITHDPVFTTPVSSTNTAVVRWSGTAGSVLQNSGVLIDGSNNITGIGTIASGAITSSGAIIGTQVDILAAGDLRLQDSTGGQYVALEAAGTTTSHTLTLPATQGSASTFLQNNGSGALSWAAAGGGALTFVGKATASNSSTLGITGIDGTYENYLILGSDLVPASDHRQFQLQFGDSSGIDTGASDYEYHLQEIGSSTTGYSGRVEDNAVFIELGNKVGNASGEGLGFALWLNMPGNGTMFATVHGTHVEWTKDGALVGGTVVGARKTTVISLTQIQLKLNAGNIATGELTVYGVKNA